MIYVSFMWLFMVHSEEDHSSNYGLNVSFIIYIIILFRGLILITLKWFKSHWQQSLLHFYPSENLQSKTYVSIYTSVTIRVKSFLNSGRLQAVTAGRRILYQQTTTQHPNDSIIRSIIVVIILSWAYKEGLVKNEGWGWDGTPLFPICFPLSNLSFSNEEKESENSGKRGMSRLRSTAPLTGSNSRG